MIPCYDILAVMCDQLLGRLQQIEKFGYVTRVKRIGNMRISFL